MLLNNHGIKTMSAKISATDKFSRSIQKGVNGTNFLAKTNTTIKFPTIPMVHSVSNKEPNESPYCTENKVDASDIDEDEFIFFALPNLPQEIVNLNKAMLNFIYTGIHKYSKGV